MATEANWYPDPTGAHQLRYWDGSTWTENVSDGGVVGKAPVATPVAVTEQAAPATDEPGATESSKKPGYRGPRSLIVMAAAAVIVIVVAANSGGSGGGSTTFALDTATAAAISTGSFFDPGLSQTGALDAAGLNDEDIAFACDATVDVALTTATSTSKDWPPVVKGPYDKVIADIHNEQQACVTHDVAAFKSADSAAAADLVAAGRVWDAHCSVGDVFAETPTATCK